MLHIFTPAVTVQLNYFIIACKILRIFFPAVIFENRLILTHFCFVSIA